MVSATSNALSVSLSRLLYIRKCMNEYNEYNCFYYADFRYCCVCMSARVQLALHFPRGNFFSNKTAGNRFSSAYLVTTVQTPLPAIYLLRAAAPARVLHMQRAERSALNRRTTQNDPVQIALFICGTQIDHLHAGTQIEKTDRFMTYIYRV